MAGGGRGAIEDVKEWSKASKDASKAVGAKFIGLAFVFHVPPFIPKSVIKNGIKGSGGPLPLFFWEEKPVTSMGVSDYDTSNILVVDKRGILRYQLVENFSQPALERVMNQVKKLAAKGDV